MKKTAVRIIWDCHYIYTQYIYRAIYIYIYYLPGGQITQTLILVFLGFLLLSRTTVLWPRKSISNQVMRGQQTQPIYKTSHKVISCDSLVLESGHCRGCDWLASHSVVFFSLQKHKSAKVWKWLYFLNMEYQYDEYNIFSLGNKV